MIERGVCAIAFSLVLTGACGAADQSVDPGVLELRDLLGIDPQVAANWSEGERAAAREVIGRAMAEPPEAGEWTVYLPEGVGVVEALADVDDGRAQRGEDSLVVVEVRTSGRTGRVSAIDTTGMTVEELVAQPVEEVARAPFVGAMVDGQQMLVNPVVVMAMDVGASTVATRFTSPSPSTSSPTSTTTSRLTSTSTSTLAERGPSLRFAGNPYDFYGSLGECAAAEQMRCQACLPNDCVAEARDSSDGNAECNTLLTGSGTIEFCANLALAILTVSRCVDGKAPQCPQVRTAGNQLSALAANDTFLADAACTTALDECLADIYGAPDHPFPIADGGVGGTEPPRDVNVDCGSCESDSSCNFDPQCDPKCDSTCEGGKCGDCSASSTTGSGGGGSDESSSCGDCGGGSGSGSSGSSDCQGGGCDSGGGSSSCGDGCSGSGSGSSSSCDSSSGGCGGSGSGGGGSSGSGNSCGKCDAVQRARAETTHRLALAVTLFWGFLPLLVLELWRRREKRKAGGAL